MASRSFEAEIQQTDQLTLVKLGGTLDEDNELLPLAGHIRGVALVDLAGIREINNCGVRDWVHWLDQVHERSPAVVLIECSPAIVAQLNQVGNFASRAYVKSFYVPYFCQACDKEKAILVDIDEFKDDTIQPPTCRCDSCDGAMTFDDLEDSYFAFIKESRRRIPPEVLEQIERFAPQGGDRKFLASADTTATFTRVPSTAGGAYSASGGGYRTIAGTTSVPSVGALRRLRNKTGVRTHRVGGGGADARPAARRKLVLIVAATAATLGFLVTALLLLR